MTLPKSKICFILRGLPGSGKTAVADFLAGVCHAAGYWSIRKSLDDFRYVDGKYVYNKEKNSEVTEKYYQSLMDWIDNNYAQDVVILDNTHSRAWEYASAKELFEAKGYTVVVLETQRDFESCCLQNSHSVPRAAVQNMVDRWEYPYRRAGDEQQTSTDG